MLVEKVFLTSDNAIRWLFLNEKVIDVNNPDGTPITFTSNGVTKMELSIGDLLVSSATSAISYNDQGQVALMLGNIPELVNGNYSVSLKVYDPSHPNGQIIVHPEIDKAQASITVVHTHSE